MGLETVQMIQMNVAALHALVQQASSSVLMMESALLDLGSAMMKMTVLMAPMNSIALAELAPVYSSRAPVVSASQLPTSVTE